MSKNRLKTCVTEKSETKYLLDYQLSRDVYNVSKSLLEPNKCYNNTFNITSNIPSFLDSSEIKIMYCLMLRKDINMFNRHCCILYKNKIIDPTALFWSNIDTLYPLFFYYPLEVYTLDKYTEVLSENYGQVELYNLLLQKEIDMHNTLITRSYQRNYGELGEFLERVYKKDLFGGIKLYQSNHGIIKLK